jgi:glutathione S-transferase
MKLYLNKTSPYARLVAVTAAEAGLSERLETVWVEPWDDPAALLAVNPAARIPALEADDGAVLIESGCICDHLVSLSGREDVMLGSPEKRRETLRRVGLGRAAMDCAFGAVIQRRFGGGEALAERWLKAVPRLALALDSLTATRAAAAISPDLGDITVAVAFDYIDFRLPAVAWRTGAPGLGAWVDRMASRASMKATNPRR